MTKFSVYRLAFAVCPGLFIIFLASGCVVRTYSVAKDRVDQEVSGNQGYLTGTAPSDAQKPKKFIQRPTRVVEIELKSPIKFERLKQPPESMEQLSSGDVSEKNKNLGSIEVSTSSEMPGEPQEPSSEFDTYKVQKDDTLQKISEKIFGTTKKWKKIFEANEDTLKSPDKIRLGQELKIPKN
jgi:LysM repeat protein